MYTPEVLIDEDAIKKRVRELATQITQDYEDSELVLVCVLKGAFIFCSDLMKELNLPIRVEYIGVSSYKDKMTSSGECQITLDLTGSIQNQHVLIVEDIVDTGLTINFLKSQFESRKPKSVKLAALLYKPTNLQHPVDIDYLAFEIENKFVIGYGLDYAGRYRELPYIGVLNADH